MQDAGAGGSYLVDTWKSWILDLVSEGRVGVYNPTFSSMRSSASSSPRVV